MRVFLDANVLFSASNPESNLARLVALAKERAAVVTSDFAREEAVRNVSVKRPAWASGLERALLGVEVVPSVLFPLPVEITEKDAPILCAAIRSGCTHLVTGDRRDFGHLFGTAIEGVRIVTPLRLAELLTDGGS